MKLNSLMVPALLILSAPALSQSPPPDDPKAMKAQALLADAFIGIRDQNPAAVKAALDNGADPNGRNWLGFTPLMWAAMRGDNRIVDMLIARGAKINETSIYGSPTTFAAMGRNGKTGLNLLGKGAAPHGKRIDGASILMLAAAGNQVELLGKLLAKKVDPNQKDEVGATALIYASRHGQLPAVQKLLAAGAAVNTADVYGRTALSYAAANGNAKVASLLISRKANVNGRDKQKATPLLLAARYNGDTETIQSLIRAGADRSARDKFGKSAFDLAAAREYTSAARLLKTDGVKLVGTESVPTPSVRQVTQRGINILQTSMSTFVKRAQCTSCHHQGIGLTAVVNAKKNGFKVDDAIIGRYMKQLEADGQQMGPAVHQALQNPQIGKVIPAVDIGDFPIGAAYLFGSLVAVGVPPNPGMAEAAQFLATLQYPDGSWKHGFERGHMQISYVTTTALVLQLLRTYGSEEQKKGSFEKARQFLSAASAKDAPELASRALGLKWAGATAEQVDKAVKELQSAQKADGGWSSSPSGRSDAYATGLALCALHQAGGVKAADPIYLRGIRYLVRTQDEDGSWYVMTKAMLANNYFDSGFPHGQSQYASFAATAWATMALMPAAETPQTASQ